MAEMTDLLALSWAAKLLSAVVAVAAVFLVLRWWDRRAGIVFPDFAEDMRHDPRAAALYLGCRVVAVCLLVGLVVAFS